MSGRAALGCDGGGDVVIDDVDGEGWGACHSRRSPGSMGDPGGYSRGGFHVEVVMVVGT